MQAIEQENVHSTSSTLSSVGKLRISDNDSFFEDCSYGSSISMNRNSNFGSNKIETFLAENSTSNKDNWVIIYDPPEKPKGNYTSSDKCNYQFL
ncbi:hypothetical protein NQ314_020398 [Rhamnusium bicolor]|uniref:Uncharacterized protein n=1 Tax=Rhamnusium bicolor TaxID=1586634 RepID=A0AAV8WLR2_9CUCU|nr:hypothetical protein NQ314_020398 [Rhamnusium bicolor]